MVIRKKVFSIAVLWVCALVPFSTFAETIIYGKAPASQALPDQDLLVASNDLHEVHAIDNTPRFGVRGSEVLGRGLSAIYQLEYGLDVEKYPTIIPRDTWVGLSGGFGSVRLGRSQTPYYNVLKPLDMFSDHGGNFRVTLDPNSISVNNINQQVDNILSYTSPDVSGFTGTFTYILQNNPLAGPVPDANERSAYNLSLSYDLDAVNIINFSFTVADDYRGLSNSGADMWAIGHQFNLSKRTRLWLEYASLSNDANSIYTISGDITDLDSGFNPVSAADQSAFSMGLNLDF